MRDAGLWPHKAVVMAHDQPHKWRSLQCPKTSGPEQKMPGLSLSYSSISSGLGLSCPHFSALTLVAKSLESSQADSMVKHPIWSSIYFLETPKSQSQLILSAHCSSCLVKHLMFLPLGNSIKKLTTDC